MKSDKIIQIHFILILFFIFAVQVFSQSTEECQICHEDSELTMEKGKRTISLFVDSDKYGESVHQFLDCVDCHEGFDPEAEPHKEGRNISSVSCEDCHDGYNESLKNDIHYRLSSRVGKNAPTCSSCHKPHTMVYPSKVKNKSRYFCSSCHDTEKSADSFHQKNKIATDECSDCHDTEESSNELAVSVHSELVCSDCHSNVIKNFDAHFEDEFITETRKTDCKSCHLEVFNEHRESVHGVYLNAGYEEAANCESCHGSHKILPPENKESLVHNSNLPSTCGGCHDDPEFEKKFKMSIILPGNLYSHSVHGKLVLGDDTSNAASCISCHGVHNIRNRVQSDSKISPVNIPNTCENCHEKEVSEYKNSIHWWRVQKGIKEAPVCNDCHSEHSISEITKEDNQEALLNLQNNTCIDCHSNKRIANKFGKDWIETEQYLNSYHGLAVTRGDKRAALCFDCHGVHSILPKSEPESLVHDQNVTATCQKCHPDASDTFSISYTHETESQEAKAVEDFIQVLYFWLIISIIGGMIIHNIIIFVFEIVKRRRREKNVIAIPRFTKNEIVQHILLLTSFIVLAITGFALKYPNSFWAEGLLSMGMTEPIRQNIHRISAVVMIALSFFHLGYLLFTSRGRDVLKELIPKLDDLKDVVQNLMYHLRLSKEHPKFRQYNYIEKAEYWALIWGTFVMGATGFILWFPTLVGDWAPIWLIKVSEIIHFYEAILASLAILVWHWFFVIFHPGEYPMSFTWLDGQMPLANYRAHHEGQFRKILLEWYRYKSNKINKQSHFTKLLVKELEKRGYSVDEVFMNELNKEPKLRIWVEQELGEEIGY